MLDGQTLFTLNILESDQTDMIVHFGRGFPLQEDAFLGLDVERGGPWPGRSEALAVLECRVMDRFKAGDHDLILGKLSPPSLAMANPWCIFARMDCITKVSDSSFSRPYFLGCQTINRPTVHP